MSKKEDLIARLKALGAELGREVNLSGSNEEMALRIAELEEELNDDDGLPGPDMVTGGTVDAISINTAPVTKEPGLAMQDIADLVTVKALVTLHINALHETSNELVAIAEAGVTVRVTQDIAADLDRSGLATIE
ncbi:DNA-packaging protein FI [Phytobacter diazotrophicus]|uniref:DNA-packaging protein FI n=1 Tax=Phytobacter diazotrophicus TaxID=395631 RepID=UPI0013EE3D6D|nr:DNA-packaging protein FI [Phytobacter diazotrophicus]QIH63423.1 DNA-packaging protein FI [Enterobacteriaceae bacterium A-F18]